MKYINSSDKAIVGFFIGVIITIVALALLAVFA